MNHPTPDTAPFEHAPAMERPRPLKELWAELRAEAQGLQDQAQATTLTTGQDLADSARQLSELKQQAAEVWPSSQITHFSLPGGHEFSLWHGHPRKWQQIHEHELRVQLGIAQREADWKLRRIQGRWTTLGQSRVKPLRDLTSTLLKKHKAIESALDDYLEHLERAREQAAWLLALPPEELRRPAGLGQYTPWGREGTHYTREYAKPAEDALKAYKAALKKTRDLRVCLPAPFVAQVRFEILKLKFWQALLRPSSKELAPVLNEAAALAALGSAPWQDELARLRRIAHEVQPPQ